MKNEISLKRRENNRFFSEPNKEKDSHNNRSITEKIQLPSTIGYENLRNHIIRLYGEDTYYRTRTLEKLRIKKAKILCDITFMVRCRDHNIIPACLRLRYSIKTQNTDRILMKASLSLLRESISRYYMQLDNISKQLYKLHIQLSNELHPVIFQQVDYLTQNRTQENVYLTTKQQMKKFDKLQQKQKPAQKLKKIQLNLDRVVLNKSSHRLSDPAISALAKGFNFAVAPSRIPVEKIICGVEAAITYLPDAAAEQLRQDTSAILRKSKPPARNISTEELRALKELRNNEDIIVLPADKGNATVILDSTDYRQKMNTILEDSAYAKTARDPTVYLEKKTRALIKASPISEKIQRSILPQEKASRVPKLYGLPKVHKPSAPLRPIVSAINSPTQALARYLARTLQPTAEQAKSYVKNSTHFVDLLQDIILEPEDILVSFDIVSLFTKVPISEALDIIERKHSIEKHIIGLARHCMSSTYFIHEGQFYKQIQGAPMGSPLSPVVANLYMEDFESRALESSPFKPRCWFRYVDDTFVIWQHGPEKLQHFLQHLNTIHDSINFTMEIEENNQLPFLDVLVHKKPDRSLGHTVYRKPTHTNRYLHATSHHHPQQIASVANTLATRSRRIADSNHLKSEERIFRDSLLQNGFPNRIIQKAWNRVPRQIPDPEETDIISIAFIPYVKGTTDQIAKLLAKENIKTVFNTDKKIGELVRSVTDNIQLEGKGVYEIPCGDCNQTYIGQTGRNMSVRRQEHRIAIDRKTTTSSLAQHVINTGHNINLLEMRKIASSEKVLPRTILESIHIEKRPHNMNKRDDSRRLPHAWKPVLNTVTVKPTAYLNTEQTNNNTHAISHIISANPVHNNRLPGTNDNPISSRTRNQTNIYKPVQI